MNASSSLTQGNIFRALIRFSLPVLLALVLQALYGAVDLAVVGKFAETTDTSGVATGSMLLHTLTCAVTGMAMGITVLVGEYIGRREPEEAGRAVGTGIFLSAVMAVVLSLVLILLAEPLARLMQCPEEAFAKAVSYIRICGGGAVFIIAYNLLGSIFRGLGDSRTPLITVFIACIVNIAGDLLLVWWFHMGASGAALATVLAQAISVVASLVLIRRMDLPFQFHASWIRPDPALLAAELRLGAPIALQEVLVGFSFLLIQSTVNAFGVVYSAAIGVGEKVCAFLMLVPSAFGQSMSAFVAQNMGANQPQRAKHALLNGIALSLTIGVCMFLLSFFRGDLLAGFFSRDLEVIAAAQSYLRAYAIDCLLTAVMFVMVGYFNGREQTLFVMAQGLIGALLVRTPAVLLFGQIPNVSLFQIGLATPMSTAVQILLCVIMYIRLERKDRLAASLS